MIPATDEELRAWVAGPHLQADDGIAAGVRRLLDLQSNGAHMTQDQLQDLREKAEKATPGPWAIDYRFGEASMVVLDDPGRLPLATTALYPLAQNNTPRVEANAAYIAAASPDVVLGLIERVEGLTKAPKVTKENIGGLDPQDTAPNDIAHTLYNIEAEIDAVLSEEPS